MSKSDRSLSSHFVMIPNAAARDRRLSGDARAALLVIATHDLRRFRVSRAYLCAEFGWGQRKAQNAINELTKHGYLIIKRPQDQNGRFGPPKWHIDLEPDAICAENDPMVDDAHKNIQGSQNTKSFGGAERTGISRHSAEMARSRDPATADRKAAFALARQSANALADDPSRWQLFCAWLHKHHCKTWSEVADGVAATALAICDDPEQRFESLQSGWHFCAGDDDTHRIEKLKRRGAQLRRQAVDVVPKPLVASGPNGASEPRPYADQRTTPWRSDYASAQYDPSQDPIPI